MLYLTVYKFIDKYCVLHKTHLILKIYGYVCFQIAIVILDS